MDRLKDCDKKVILSIISFGDEVHIRLPYTQVSCLTGEQKNLLRDKFSLIGDEIRGFKLLSPAISIITGSYKGELRSKGYNLWEESVYSVLGTAINLTCDMLEDADETPNNIYNPSIILISSKEPTEGWREEFSKAMEKEIFREADRFALVFNNQNVYCDYFSDFAELSEKQGRQILEEKWGIESLEDKRAKNKLSTVKRAFMSNSSRYPSGIDEIVSQFRYDPIDNNIVKVEEEDTDEVPTIANAVSADLIDPAVRV